METDLDFDALVTRMIDLSKTSTALGIEAEAIGRELHDLGGIEAMQSALFLFAAAWQADLMSQVSPIAPMDWVLAWQGMEEWVS